jgi:hypothetical protein
LQLSTMLAVTFGLGSLAGAGAFSAAGGAEVPPPLAALLGKAARLEKLGYRDYT